MEERRARGGAGRDGEKKREEESDEGLKALKAKEKDGGRHSWLTK